jgi:hypothetical protein
MGFFLAVAQAAYFVGVGVSVTVMTSGGETFTERVPQLSAILPGVFGVYGVVAVLKRRKTQAVAASAALLVYAGLFMFSHGLSFVPATLIAGIGSLLMVGDGAASS